MSRGLGDCDGLTVVLCFELDWRDHADLADFTLRVITATALSAFRVSLEVWMLDPSKNFENIVATAFRHLARGFESHT